MRFIVSLFIYIIHMFSYVHVITPALMHEANMVNIKINCLLNA